MNLLDFKLNPVAYKIMPSEGTQINSYTVQKHFYSSHWLLYLQVYIFPIQQYSSEDRSSKALL